MIDIRSGIEEITIEAKVISADGTVRDLGVVGYASNAELTQQDLFNLSALAEDLTKGN